MRGKKIVTNLRIDSHDWMQVKSMAAEAGMSVNEYINRVLTAAETREMLGEVKPQHNRRKIKSRDDFFQQMIDIAKIPNKPMGVSAEDEIIYGIK